MDTVRPRDHRFPEKIGPGNSISGGEYPCSTTRLLGEVEFTLSPAISSDRYFVLPSASKAYEWTGPAFTRNGLSGNGKSSTGVL